MALTQFDLSELLDALRAGGDVDLIRSSVEMVLQALIDAEADIVPRVVARERVLRAPLGFGSHLCAERQHAHDDQEVPA